MASIIMHTASVYLLGLYKCNCGTTNVEYPINKELVADWSMPHKHAFWLYRNHVGEKKSPHGCTITQRDRYYNNTEHTAALAVLSGL